MIGAGRRRPDLPASRRAARWAAAAAAAVLAARCASAPPTGPRDHFPLDPREGLQGPFDDAVADGWNALLAGDAARARGEFARAARSGPSARAARIGEVEALVASGKSSEALSSCAGALEDDSASLPWLVACGEAEVRAGSPVTAYELYARAASEARPPRPGLSERAQKLLGPATDDVLAQAARDAEHARFEPARAQIARALAWNPRSSDALVAAADVECAAGEKEKALQFDREALSIGGMSVQARAEAGRLALEVGDDALAVSVFDALAAEDVRFAEEAAQARLAFRIANWPEAERQAARARRLTRAGAAGLVWWMFPEVREARITGGVVATDVLERRDSRPMIRSVSLGLLDVDPETHRARPDATLSRKEAAALIFRLAETLSRSGGSLACLRGAPWPRRASAETIRLAARCDLLSESGGAAVGGPEFTRGLDRLRSLLPAGEGQEP